MSRAKTRPGTEQRIGYGRPPKRTQFEKGQSGNPKGRRKGSRNRVTVTQRLAMDELVRIIESKRTPAAAKIEAAKIILEFTIALAEAD